MRHDLGHESEVQGPIWTMRPGKAILRGQIAQRGDFLWRLDDGKVPLRRRDKLPVGMRKIDLIAPEEIGRALVEVVRASHGIDDDGAITETSGLFGFKRTGPDIRGRLERVIRKLVRDGVLERRGDFLQIGESSIEFPQRR